MRTIIIATDPTEQELDLIADAIMAAHPITVVCNG